MKGEMIIARRMTSGFLLYIMFTGIIEEIGKVSSLRSCQGARELLILGEEVSKSLKIGESVSVDGVCLTTTEIKKNIFKVFLSKETLSRTTLGRIKSGTKVNLERAMAFGGRLGGHLVTGHIDAIGAIRRTRRFSDSLEMEIEAPKDDSHLLALRGSIAVDGVSLTIASLKDNLIKIVIIPHTAKMTTLGIKREADRVNLEYDIIGKYIWRFYEKGKTITKGFLKEAWL